MIGMDFCSERAQVVVMKCGLNASRTIGKWSSNKVNECQFSRTDPFTNVTVNGNTALFYGDATFAAAGLSLTSSYTAVASDTNGRWATNTVNVDLAASIPYQYDLNGNLTNDGLRSFAYDDENQLIQVWVPGAWSSVFTYDGKMRRRIRQEFTWTNSAWVQTNAVYYVYDGNLVIQERDLNNQPTTTYTRGNDLSGNLQGAGGIGGLLARTSQQYADGPLAGNAFYHADANGNVTMLVNSSQAVVAKYLYDAFGNVLSASGLLANANRYQFSSKEKDLNSGLVYYLYRFYDPNLQRWLNRDPLGEIGFEVTRDGLSLVLLQVMYIDAISGESDLYDFVRNSPTAMFDSLGLCPGDRKKCMDKYLHDNYGNFGAAIANNFGLGNIFNGNLGNYITSGLEIGAVKGGILGGLAAYGQSLVEVGGAIANVGNAIVDATALAVDGAAVAGAGLGAFGTGAEAMAYLHCRDQEK
jgi:RHS repeat-associated protein